MKEVFVFRFQKDADNEVLETLIGQRFATLNTISANWW